MTVADTLGPRSSDYAPIGLERAMSRVDALLVGRANTSSWWTSLERAIDDVGRSFADHVSRTGGTDGVHLHIMRTEPHLVVDLRGIDRDHEEIAQDILELQGVVMTCPHEPAGVALALTTATEVVARIRGYQRRLSAMLHRVSMPDQVQPG